MYWVIEAIWQLLKAARAVTEGPLRAVKAVYWGDPIQIPRSSQPALIVQPARSRYTARGSRYDRKEHDFEVRLVDNIENYLVVDKETGQKVPSVQEFIRRMEMTDENGMTLNNTVAGILMRNQMLPYTVKVAGADVARNASLLVEVRTVEYVYNSARNFPTFEAILTGVATVQGDRS